jgi:broad specificity phosphatase PhoE
MPVILLLRHAEAVKNVEDRHGGGGTDLTSVGLSQCTTLALFVKSKCREPYAVVASGTPQIWQTAECIARNLGVVPERDERIRGLDLGVLAGLSRAEAARLWPEEAQMLDRWREGQLKITELRLKGVEPLATFRERVADAFQVWQTRNDIQTVVAVCSRSTLIMLVNLARLGPRFNYDDYAVYDFDIGSAVELSPTREDTYRVTFSSALAR